MNYDSDISSNVNLSRVLDEMIIDGSDMENIVQFLKSHEENMPDIYRHSAFAYSLYDIMAHPNGIDLFLIEHMRDLRSIEFCYAANAIAEYLHETGINRWLLEKMKSEYRRNEDIVSFVQTMRIVPNVQEMFFRFDIDLVDWLNKTTDSRDYYRIISHTFLGMSVFQASMFVRLKPSSQFLLLKTIQEKTVERQYGHKFDSGKTRAICGELVCTLLRQLLVLNNIELFNWVLSVLEMDYPHGPSAILRLAVQNSISNVIPSSLYNMVYDSIYESEDKVSFAELVFEMNLLETSFEPYNLFLFIYLDNNRFLKEMKENRELIGFFNLPFDWDGMKWMKDDYKIEKTRGSPF